MFHEHEAVRFRLFAFGQFLLWIAAPALAFHNLPLDVVEGLGWGHGWPIGTHKHPPLQAWILEIAAILGGRQDAAIYATGAGSLLLTFWALWRFGRGVLAPPVALMGVMALASCFYFATSTTEFNPNVVQTPLYALCGWLFWRAMQEDRWRDWLLFGLCAGLGMLGKYSFALMLLAMGGFILADSGARRLLRRPGIYGAAAVGTLVFAPHGLWLIAHDFMPFHYAQSRGGRVDGAALALLHGGRFFLDQMLAVAPIFIVLWLARTRSAQQCGARTFGDRARAFVLAVIPENFLSFAKRMKENLSGIPFSFLQQKLDSGSRHPPPLAANDLAGMTKNSRSLQRYLAFLAWGPVFLAVLASVLTGVQMRSMWGMGFWPFIGLWAAARWQSSWDHSRLARLALIAAMAVMPMALFCGARLSAPLGFRPWRTEFPGRQLASEAEVFWRDQQKDAPLRIVAGDSWFGGNIAWYAPPRPQLMIRTGAVNVYSPWAPPEAARRYGALAVWDPDGGGEDVPPWAAEVGAVKAIKTIHLQYGLKSIRARFAIIAPDH